VGEVRRLHLSGVVAWLAWLFVHIFFLIGFRNRFMVILQWAWHYATFGRSARLIVDTAEQWQLVAAEAVQRPDAGDGAAAAVREAPRRVSGAEKPTATGTRH
jgi:NADH dehydrogenase